MCVCKTFSPLSRAITRTGITFTEERIVSCISVYIRCKGWLRLKHATERRLYLVFGLILSNACIQRGKFFFSATDHPPVFRECGGKKLKKERAQGV